MRKIVPHLFLEYISHVNCQFMHPNMRDTPKYINKNDGDQSRRRPNAHLYALYYVQQSTTWVVRNDSGISFYCRVILGFFSVPSRSFQHIPCQHSVKAKHLKKKWTNYRGKKLKQWFKWPPLLMLPLWTAYAIWGEVTNKLDYKSKAKCKGLHVKISGFFLEINDK